MVLLIHRLQLTWASGPTQRKCYRRRSVQHVFGVLYPLSVVRCWQGVCRDSLRRSPDWSQWLHHKAQLSSITMVLMPLGKPTFRMAKPHPADWGGENERNNPARLEEVLQAWSLLMTCHMASTGINILGMSEVVNTRSLQPLQWVPEDEDHLKDLWSGLRRRF